MPRREFARAVLNVGLSRTEIIETVIQIGPYKRACPEEASKEPDDTLVTARPLPSDHDQ